MRALLYGYKGILQAEKDAAAAELRDEYVEGIEVHPEDEVRISWK